MEFLLMSLLCLGSLLALEEILYLRNGRRSLFGRLEPSLAMWLLLLNLWNSTCLGLVCKLLLYFRGYLVCRLSECLELVETLIPYFQMLTYLIWMLVNYRFFVIYWFQFGIIFWLSFFWLDQSYKLLINLIMYYIQIYKYL